MTSEISMIVTIAIAFAAIISPIITTIITNRHQKEMQKKSFLINHRLVLYRDFLDVLNSTLPPDPFTKEKSAELKRIFSQVYLVCSDETQYLLNEFNELMAAMGNSEIASTQEYRDLCLSITYSMRRDMAAMQ